ncbi:MAG TPA: hypothetical protein VFT58_05215 [Nitrososphaera sp.]|nr:hypothetical protein [Nitrososphaera sp.]
MAQPEIVATLGRLGRVCYKGKEDRACGEVALYFLLCSAEGQLANIREVVSDALKMTDNVTYSAPLEDLRLKIVVSFPGIEGVDETAVKGWTNRFTKMLEGVADEKFGIHPEEAAARPAPRPPGQRDKREPKPQRRGRRLVSAGR